MTLFERFPVRRADATQFFLNVVTDIERKPSVEFSCYPDRTVREGRVGMHAGTRSVRPGTHTIFPGSDDPAFLLFVMAGDKRV